MGLSRSSTAELESQLQNTGCLFGIYLRYVFSGRFTLYRALVTVTFADALSVAFNSAYFVPILFISGKSITLRLGLIIA